MKRPSPQPASPATSLSPSHAMRMFGGIGRSLLAAFLILTLISIVLVGGATAVVGFDALRQAALARLSSVADLKQQAIQDWIVERQNDLGVIRSDPALSALMQTALSEPENADAVNALVTRLSAQTGSGQPFGSLFLIDAHDQSHVSTDPTQVGKVHSGKPYLVQGRLGPYVSSPYFDLTLGANQIAVAAPVQDRNGQALGVLVGQTNLDHLSKIVLSGSGLGSTGESYLVSRNFRFLTQTRFTPAEDVLPLAGVRSRLGDPAASSGQDIYENYAGASVAGVYRFIPGLEVYLLTEQAVAEVLTQAQRALLASAAISLVATGIAAAGAYLTTRRLTRPIVDLTQTVMRVTEGDLQQTATIERRDEIGVLAQAFNRMTTQLRESIGTLETQVQARTEQLRASADVGRAAASILDPDRLLREVTSLITERFGFYYTAIFTLDEDRRYAVLREATGEAGQTLKARGHRLEVGGRSMVGYATANLQPRVALDVGQEAVRFANPLLPETRSEIALPLVAGGRVLGALDVQATQAAAFDENSIAVLQSMADQVAVALANAQSFDTIQATLQATTRLYDLSRALSAATSAHVAYAAVIQPQARLQGLDRLDLLLVAARTPSGEPLEYRVAAEWDAPTGAHVEPGRIYTSEQLPLISLADQASMVLVRNADDPQVPLPTRRILEGSGWKAVLLAPLLVRNQFEGLLIAAARRPLNFEDIDTRYVQSITEQLAVVLNGLRSHEESRLALERIALLNQRLSGEAWRHYLASAQQLLVESGRAPETGSGNRLAAPIVVRGETLGTLELEDADAQRQWTDEERNLLSTFSAEVALAIENARLIEQTQRRAAREKQLNQIAERLRQAAGINSILRIAAEELGQALETSHANVRLGTPASVTLPRKT
ncbi:MAG TPA: GAF domain-containing protein [Anaerolineae bacterium]|nr:GAF domain-containing protein [Anaerolineae bacterium]